MKKGFILALAMVMAACVSIGVTLAYLFVETPSVVNTFKYGDINIELWENDYVLSTNSLDSNTKVTSESDYKLIPGNSMPKNPTVTVKANSEACWLFVKIEESENFESFMTYGIAKGWNALPGVEDVFYCEGSATTVDKDYAILADNKVNVKDSVLKTELNALTEATYPKLTFTAYAVQKANVNTVVEAWALVRSKGVSSSN